MADRYWVGGTGTWNTTSTTNWSDTSGGSSGFSVPTVADNVFFDQAGTYTVTMTGALAGLDITVSAGTVTFATGTSPTLNIRGSMLLAAGTIWSSTGAITFSSTTTGKTVTTNGVTINAAITFNGVGGEWTLGSALTVGGSGTSALSAGTFDTGNYNLTLATGVFQLTGSSAKTLNLGSSTISTSGYTDNSTGTTTINAGTSVLNISSTGTVNFNSKTYYDVNITSASSAPTMSNLGTFRNLSFTSATFNFRTLTVSSPLGATVTGTLSISTGASLANRSFLRSATVGTAVTLTCNAFSGDNVDFRDITIAGSAAPISGSSLGDCKGNSGVTFTAPKTVYWNLAAGGLWTATAWALTSIGTPSAANFPLPQDTCIFSTTGLNDGATVTFNSDTPPYVGTLDMSARVAAISDMILSISPGSSFPDFGVQIYGNLIFGTGCSFTGTAFRQSFGFYGRTTQLFTSAGITSTAGVLVNAPSTIVELQDNFTCSKASNDGVAVVRGTFDANGFNVTLTDAAGGVRADSGTATRAIVIGSGTWTISGTAPWTVTSSGMTTTGTGTIALNSASSKTFAGGGGDYSGITVANAGAGALVVTGSNTFGTLSNTVQPTTFSFTSGTTQTIANWSVSGTAGNLVTIQSATAASHTLFKSTGTVSADYLTISRSTATSSGATWYAGANSTNGGNNSGWVFTAPPAGTSDGNFLMLL
jgi:hypothetical protein